MPSTTEVTREELEAEFIAREAVNMVGNRIGMLLYEEDRDIHAMLEPAAGTSDALIHDVRLTEMFDDLFPDDDDPDDRMNAESFYIAARILRAIVYHAEYLRRESERMFEVAMERRRKAEAAEKGGTDVA